MSIQTPSAGTAGIAGLALLAALFAAIPARAGDDHDHGPAPTAATGPALPRFTASSELFELVGVVNGTQITVYLDRFADNAPVKGAQLQLEVGGAKVALKEHEEGEFEGQLAQALKPGLTPVTATIVAGTDSDLLAADLDLHAETHADAAPSRSWKAYAGWAAGAAIAALALAWAGRRAAARRSFGGAA